MAMRKPAPVTTRPPQASSHTPAPSLPRQAPGPKDAPLPVDLTAFDISAERGFLPRRDPLASLPRRWPSFLNDLVEALPKLLAARQLRAHIDALRQNQRAGLGSRGPDELRCAARILSFA